jgi:zinc transport system permease protein
LVARRESLQILALAQGALVGNLLGRLIFHENEVAIMLTSLVCFLVLKTLFVFMKSSMKINEVFFIVAYLSLLSISYLLISIFPGLEGHMSVGFFGDIVSLSENLTFVLIGIFIILISLFTAFKTRLLRRTFEKSVLGIDKFNILEELLFATVFVCSLYGLGFLYSVTTMIFPAILIGRSGKNLKGFILISLILTASSSISGLGVSILFERLSTVPTQVLMLLFLLSFVGMIMSKVNLKK